jgi:hypothetical protein
MISNQVLRDYKSLICICARYMYGEESAALARFDVSSLVCNGYLGLGCGSTTISICVEEVIEVLN